MVEGLRVNISVPKDEAIFLFSGVQRGGHKFDD